MSIANDVDKIKKDALLKEGWSELRPEFNLDYLFNLDPQHIIRRLGFFISAVTEEINRNPLSLFGPTVEHHRNRLVDSLCPSIVWKNTPANTSLLVATWPVDRQDYDNLDCAMEELTYHIIKKSIDSLGDPISIIQNFGDDTNSNLFSYPTKDFSFDKLQNLSMFKHTCISWKDAYVYIEIGNRWGDNSCYTKHTFNFYSKNLKELTSIASKNIGLELNPSSYQLGELAPKFPLTSFPSYIQKHTKSILEDLSYFNEPIERFNLLIEGPPGTGKTSWSQAFACEVLAPLGYLILCVDYNSLQSLVIPEYIDKACIIVNDADTLAIDREFSTKGETEQILSWLDGARTSFIKPFYMEKRSSVITIMTANSIDRWDEAALRKGRIHKHIKFDEIKLSDL